ncbi:MAG: SH3 domain-containing protein [Treponemataceae bacterium]|nr:SH3 domain-containing protein [Treponemataceae bacterium]
MCEIVYNGINYIADASKFVPQETKCVFDEGIISSTLKNDKKALISKNYVDLLFSQDRDSVSKIEPYGYEQYNAYKTEFDYEWFLEVHEFNPSYIFNVVIGLHTIFGYYSFYVLDIEKEADGYKISAVVEKHWDVVVEPTDPQVSGKKQILTLTVDGDYLTIRSDEKTYGTFVIVSETLLSQGTSLLQNNTCDLSKVTWPRHADGTCDYEDANDNLKTGASANLAAPVVAVVPKPAPAMGKTATVTENLRLHTDDKTAAEVVTTLAAGTRVKLFAPGREDTIDGIKSSWVQVSVLDGAKDKDGNAIEAETIGWLFSGYLSKTEAAESECPNEEASAAKEAVALPIMPIMVGGAAFVILLAVVLLAFKKRKNQ